jgi:hypothetical protein
MAIALKSEMGDGNLLNARVHASTAGERVTETLIL